MGLFSNKKAKEKLIGVAMNSSINAMNSYLKSRKKYEDCLIIFNAEGMDNNVNLLSETIFLMGVYDALVRSLDNKYEILNHEDAMGLLQAEMVSRAELEGHETWLRQALKEGEYVQGSYQISSKSIQVLNVLFVAGQLSYVKFYTKIDGIVPDTLGLEDGYEFYDFKEFKEIKNRFDYEVSLESE